MVIDYGCGRKVYIKVVIAVTLRDSREIFVLNTLKAVVEKKVYNVPVWNVVKTIHTLN